MLIEKRNGKEIFWHLFAAIFYAIEILAVAALISLLSGCAPFHIPTKNGASSESSAVIVCEKGVGERIYCRER